MRKRPHSFLEHSNGNFINEAFKNQMIDGRHLEMGNIFPFQVDTFSMSISQLKEKIIPTTFSKPYGFWRANDERISWRHLMGCALQHIMECKDIQEFEEVGVLQWEDTKFMQNEIHHPHWDEWMLMWRKGLQGHLQNYDTGQQEAWLC